MRRSTLIAAVLLVQACDGAPVGGVRYRPVDDKICSASSCDDGDACTEDTCEDGSCRHTPVSCPGGSCLQASCDPSVGCLRRPVEDGSACDGLCGAGECEAGVCVGSVEPTFTAAPQLVDGPASVIRSQTLLVARDGALVWLESQVEGGGLIRTALGSVDREGSVLAGGRTIDFPTRLAAASDRLVLLQQGFCTWAAGERTCTSARVELRDLEGDVDRELPLGPTGPLEDSATASGLVTSGDHIWVSAGSRALHDQRLLEVTPEGVRPERPEDAPVITPSRVAMLTDGDGVFLSGASCAGTGCAGQLPGEAIAAFDGVAAVTATERGLPVAGHLVELATGRVSPALPAATEVVLGPERAGWLFLESSGDRCFHELAEVEPATGEVRWKLRLAEGCGLLGGGASHLHLTDRGSFLVLVQASRRFGEVESNLTEVAHGRVLSTCRVGGDVLVLGDGFAATASATRVLRYELPGVRPAPQGWVGPRGRASAGNAAAAVKP